MTMSLKNQTSDFHRGDTSRILRQRTLGRILPWALAALGALPSCAPSSERRQAGPDLQQTVNSLQQGELIRDLNGAGNSGSSTLPVSPKTQPPSPEPPPPGATPVASSSPAPTGPAGEIAPIPPAPPPPSPTPGASSVPYPSSAASAPPPAPSPVADPCPDVPSDGSADGLSYFLSCLSDQYRSAETLGRAFEYFQSYRLSGATQPFSTMSEPEIDQYLVAHGNPATDPDPKRSFFSGAELDELSALARRRRRALARAADAVTAAFRAHPALGEALSASSLDRDRFLGLLAGGGFDGPQAQAFVERFWDACRQDRLLVPTRGNLGYVQPDLLRLFGLDALLGQKESLPLDLARELDQLPEPERYQRNPIISVFYARGDQQGRADEMARYRRIYARYRDGYEKPIPPHPARDPRPARVAFLDAGVDYLRFPKLIAPYLGNGPGELQSFDYADDVESPYAPAVLELKHGTGTIATLLTLISHQAADILARGQLELAEWKVVSTRELLAGIWGGTVSWDNREDRVPRALIDNIQKASEPGAVSPDIVSVSMVFYEVAAFRALGVPRILLQAPWLWVMAAGNDGRNVERDPSTTHGCFSEFPPSDRDDTRILCVGALLQGKNGNPDRIAGYSNYGSGVDVFAYSTYDRDCPNGTSCATPAITAAAAILKARFPRLTARQIKRVIVDASVSRTLEVDPGTLPPGITSGGWRTVRVFDPVTMMDRAIQVVRNSIVFP